MLGGKQRIL